MRWLVVAPCALLFACSYPWDDFDPRQQGHLTQSTGGAMGGAGGSGGSSVGGGSDCPPLFDGPPGDTFSEPEPIGVGVGDDPALSQDLLELYFNADHAGERFTIWRATRSCPGDPWSDPVEVAELDLGLEATSPVLSADSLTLFVSYADDPVVKIFNIHQAERAARSDPWSAPALVPQLQSFAEDRANWLGADGLSLGLDSARNGDLDLFLTTRADPDADWAVPAPIDELNSSVDESESSVTDNGRTIVFGRDVSGASGEIFRAERQDANTAWETPRAISELNTSADESDPWISPDGRIIVFTRYVDGDPVIHQAMR